MLPLPETLPRPGAGPALRDLAFDELRRVEFARLDERDDAYLDYTGSALPLASHLRWHLALLEAEVFGNPHSENPVSRASTQWIDAARGAVLAFLDADPGEYTVVFTANASAAAKLVGESFPFSRRSRLLLSADNHNSVLGLREFARHTGITTRYLLLNDDLRMCDLGRGLDEPRPRGPSLVALPAQSNFSGVRHPLALVRLARGLGYTVLLDAAAYLPTASLSLRSVPADFVTLSLYKIMGYPTGVGALVARHDALERLRRPWFAGGTVEFSSVQNDRHSLQGGAAGFEDGTPAFQCLSAVPSGLALLADVGMERIGDHVRGLTGRLLDGLTLLRHSNGRPLVAVHGPTDLRMRGGTVAFNLADRHGRWIPHDRVELGAAARRVSVRSGCFCNPGAAERAFGFDAERVAQCLDASTRQGRQPRLDKAAFARCMGGVPTGAVRASVGMATTARDVDRLLAALEEWLD